MTLARDLYLDLLQRCILNTIYKDPPRDPWHGIVRDETGKQVVFGQAGGVLTVDPGPYNPVARQYGADWPMTAHSMIGEHRLRNVRELIERIIDEKIPGDLIEAGVWRGGACIFMRGILKAYGEAGRSIYVADSFEGLPRPDPAHQQDAGDWHHTATMLAVSLEQVIENFKAYDLFDDRLIFVKGWFKDTLPKLTASFALVRLDGDMYESTMDGLVNLYPKLVAGGFVIIDDYFVVRGCQQAVDEYRRTHRIVGAIQSIDGKGAYWRKEW